MWITPCKRDPKVQSTCDVPDGVEGYSGEASWSWAPAAWVVLTVEGLSTDTSANDLTKGPWTSLRTKNQTKERVKSQEWRPVLLLPSSETSLADKSVGTMLSGSPPSACWCPYGPVSSLSRLENAHTTLLILYPISFPKSTISIPNVYNVWED